MKKSVTALALGAILIPAAVLAGGYYGDHGERAEHRAERMAEYLKLNDEQRAEVQKLFKEQRAKRQEMRQQMRQDMRAGLDHILTPEQQAKWQAMREQRMAKCDRHDDKGHHEGPRHERDDD